MITSRKLSYLPVVVLLVLVGMFAFHSPVHAEDVVPPVSDAPAETQPEAPAADSPVAQAPETAPVVAPSDAPAGNVEAPAADNPVVQAPETPTEVATGDVPAAEVEAPAADPVVVPTVTENPSADQATVAEPDNSTAATTDTPAPVADVEAPPASSDLVVVNSEGEGVPMATVESEKIMATGDPYFTVGSTLYQFFKTGSGLCGVSTTCWESTTPIQAAIDYMAANSLTPTDKKLYIEADTYNENVVINGSLNGVKGLTGIYGLGTTPEDVTINGSLTIRNFLTGFSVNNLFVTNSSCSNCAAILAEDNNGLIKLTDVKATANGSNSRGIEIHHSGSVELNRVNATGSTSNGAYIVNAGTGALIIKNSSISGNVRGLYIDTNGAATLTGVSASDNYGDYGAYIHSLGLNINQSIFSNNGGNGLEVIAHDSGGSVTIQNSQFNNNGISGMDVRQKGNVSLTNIRANSNQANGVYLDTCDWSGVDGTFCRNPFTGNVSILNAVIVGNGISVDGSGLYVMAKGTINVTNVTSSLNGNSLHVPAISGYGATLYNNRVTVPAVVNVTNSTFNNNNQTGLVVLSKGVITIKDISANNNTNEGTTLENNITGVLAGINIQASPDVVNNFNYNADNGLKVNSNGAVVLNAVNADGNVAGTGIIVNNAGGTGVVTIDGVKGTSISNNGGDGIWVVSKGFITLKNLTVSWNDGYGALLDNTTGPAGVSILVSLPGWYNGFENNGDDGLRILTNGAVIVQRSKASDNQHNGAYINNSTGLGNVTISDSSFNKNGQTAPVSGTDYGLFVQTKGIVTLTNINGNGNGKSAGAIYSGGAWLDNSTSPTAKTITITKGFFVDNFGVGMDILASGAVMYKTGTISNNQSSGVSIDNRSAIANQNVTVDSVNFW
jgi:putative surface-exposed virulence protein